jgi:hypothetical protein
MLDIFVKQKTPRHHILNYSEQFTQGGDFKKDFSFFRVKELLE